ncbi:MAG: DUF362 domain-containing protein [Candidatus Hodarchaeota archaeon]
MKETLIDNKRFQVYKENGRWLGFEKPHEVYTHKEDIFIQEIEKDSVKSMSNGFDKINAKNIFKKGDLVAIKVNLGGGIHHVLSSYTDPDLVRTAVIKLRELGTKPFVCEANMRGHRITPQILQVRDYTSFMQELKVPWVNLSTIPKVSFKFLGIKTSVDLPLLLLKPNVKIISFPPPKHHWECGITCAQKNMYGAISNYRKSRYHRYFEMIDYVVAGAARIMKPVLSIVGSKQLGAGLGPHFCIPFNFYKLIFAQDMLSCDKYCAEFLGYPVERIKYYEINRQGADVKYHVLPGSAEMEKGMLEKIQENYIDPKTVDLYKKTLFIQYFIPSFLQIKAYHHFEWLLTWMNHKYYVPQGDKPKF